MAFDSLMFVVKSWRGPTHWWSQVEKVGGEWSPPVPTVVAPMIYRVVQKTEHGFLCNNFADSQSFFIIFGTYTYRKFATG